MSAGAWLARSARRGGLRALLLFLAAFAAYLANGRTIGTLDARAARLQPFALWLDGSLALDPFLPPAIRTGGPCAENEPWRWYWIRRARDGSWASLYPVVTPLLVSPLYLPVVGRAAELDRAGPEFEALARGMEKISAATVAAAFVAVFDRVALRLAPPLPALVVTLVAALATETWAVSSQALWQHGASELLLSLLLLACLRPSRPFLAGLAAGLLVANRPTGAFFAAAAGALFARDGLRPLAAFGAGGLVLALPAVLRAWAALGHPLGGYASLASFFALDAGIPGRLAALLVSPGRGLLAFTPVLVFALPAILGRGAPEERRVLRAFLPAVAGLLLLLSTFAGWDGGESYGPRYLTDAVPVLVLALLPALRGLASVWARTAFAALALVSIGVQAVGAVLYPAGGTNVVLDPWGRFPPAVELAAALGAPAPLPPAAAPDAGELRLEWVSAELALSRSGVGHLLARVEVRNRGEGTWLDPISAGSVARAVRLAGSWDGEGEPSVDPAAHRIDLAGPVEPGESVRLALPICPPPEPGRHRLAVDLVAEGRAWFGDAGNEVLTLDWEAPPPP